MIGRACQALYRFHTHRYFIGAGCNNGGYGISGKILKMVIGPGMHGFRVAGQFHQGEAVFVFQDK
jgi:hypothetical protein